jgi:hypothetical protein
VKDLSSKIGELETLPVRFRTIIDASVDEMREKADLTLDFLGGEKEKAEKKLAELKATYGEFTEMLRKKIDGVEIPAEYPYAIRQFLAEISRL